MSQSSCSLLSFMQSHPLLWRTYRLCPQEEFRASIRTYWFCRIWVAPRSPYPQWSSLFCSKTSIVLTQGKFASQLSLYFHLAYNRALPRGRLANRLACVSDCPPACLPAVCKRQPHLSPLACCENPSAVPWKSKYILDCCGSSLSFEPEFHLLLLIRHLGFMGWLKPLFRMVSGEA